MKVFIGNFPGTALLTEIQEFLRELELHADFSHHRGRDCERRSYHYLVTVVDDDRQALELIRTLNGIRFQGNTLVVREYIERRPCSPGDWMGQEQRINSD